MTIPSTEVQTWLLLHKVTLTMLAEFDFGPSIDEAMQKLLDAIPPPTDEPTLVMMEPVVTAAQELLELLELPWTPARKKPT